MVSPDEVRRLFGALHDNRIAEIVKLGPSLQEIELAAICLDGRTHILVEGGHHLSATAARILEIVLSDDEALEPDR